jgi:hypothetical protein
MPIANTSGAYLERRRPDELADIVDVVLDKGLVVDAFLRVAPIGTEILMIDSRITSGSIDTYLRFVDGVNRIDF